MYDEFVREEEPQKKTRKPLVNGRVDGFGINSNIGQGQGAAHKKSNKNKSKSKVADTPTSRMERVEKAIQDLKAEDVRKVLTTCKTGEPNNPLVWLTAVAHMFNMKIIGNVKDLVNSDKSFGKLFHNYLKEL